MRNMHAAGTSPHQIADTARERGMNVSPVTARKLVKGERATVAGH